MINSKTVTPTTEKEHTPTNPEHIPPNTPSNNRHSPANRNTRKHNQTEKNTTHILNYRISLIRIQLLANMRATLAPIMVLLEPKQMRKPRKSIEHPLREHEEIKLD